MRKFSTFIVAVLPALCAVSCYKDLSTEADTVIPDIIITGIEPRINVVYGEEVTITASVSQEGRTLDDLTLLWEMDLHPNNINYPKVEMGDGLTFSHRVTNRPSDSPYVITLSVTDNKTGLTAVAGCSMYVGSSLGEGLLVAHTRDGGATSDFDLVASRYLTWDYTSDEPRYTRDIYALANGTPLAGRVNAVCEIVDSDGAALNENRIMVGTDSHIYAMDPLTFEEDASDGALFNSSTQTEFGTTALFNLAGVVHGAIIGGQAFNIYTSIDRVYSKFGYGRTPSDIFRAGNIAHASMVNGSFDVFNETDYKFYTIRGWQSFNGSFSEVSTTPGFSLQGARSIGGGETKGQNLAFLMKDAAGDYHVVVLDHTGDPAAIRDFQLTSEGLDDIVSVAFCDNSDIMYYATPDALYSTIIAAGRVSSRKVNWSPESADEKITSVRQYTQGWYGTHQYEIGYYPYQLEYNRLQIIITTYNEKTGEGKFYLRPYNVTSGLFTSKDNGVYGGFGEITAIAPTFR